MALHDKLAISVPGDVLWSEYVRICSAQGDYLAMPSGVKIVLNFQYREFFKREIELWDINALYKGLPMRSWIYFNRLKYLNKKAEDLTDFEILRGFRVSGCTPMLSHFSPLWIKKFIKEFNVKSIYDPCGGWGHRLLGAGKDFEYIYNDINKKVKDNCVEISNHFNMVNKTFYSKDAAGFTPREKYDAVFTCPPYFNTEIYSGKGAENLPPDKFIKWWTAVVKSSVLCKPRLFAFVISSKYLNIMHLAVLSAAVDYEFIDQIDVGKTNRNHFQKKTKGNEGPVCDKLLIYARK